MRRILTIAFGWLAAALVAHGQQTNVLILYDGAAPYGWVGNLHAKMLANLMGHFDLSYQIQPVEAYTQGEADHARATFYLGVIYDNPLPAAFTNDVLTTTNRVCWIKYNLWHISGTAGAPLPFDTKFGFRFGSIDSSGYSNVLYKGETFLKNQDDPELGLVDVLDPAKVSTPMTAWKGDGSGATSMPYLVHSSNLWYVADSPFSFISEDDRYVAFADSLHDILGIDHAESHQAIIRFEDVTMNVYQTNEVIAVVDYMRSNNLPFGLAFIPVYTDPLGVYNGGVPDTHHISDAGDPEAVAFRACMQYAVTNGGQILIHGYTHQYSVVPNPTSGTTADDYEFWRETYQATNSAVLDLYRPVPEDSASWASGRVAAATNELFQAGLPWVGWEVPHYAASAADYLVFATNFPTTMQRTLCFADDYDPTNGHLAGQFFPYLIHRDIYGQQVVPENLGYFGPASFAVYAGRPASAIIRSAQRNLVVRDGWANAFYHGFYGVSNVQTIVEGVQALGYTYVPVLPSGKPVITLPPYSETVLAGTQEKLSVAVIGTSPFRYQWKFNSANILSATNAFINFPSVQPTNAGTYSVTVTNSFGSTNATALLNVVTTPPVIYISPVAGAGNFNLAVSTVSGVTCQVVDAGTPNATVWQPLTNLLGTGGVINVGTISAASSNQFFRAVYP